MKTNLFKIAAIIGLVTGILVMVSQFAERLALSETITFELFLGGLVIIAFFIGVNITRTVSTDQRVALTSLTARELDILSHIGNGKTNKEIAQIHSIEVSTVKTHVNNLYGKLQVENRKQARELYKTYDFRRSTTFIHPQ